ncbi:MAG: hypothetical protein K6G31_08920 [Paludibacteraceae bacterium]|nr:hypothetical protein [Paludibacteraceae bacterium]MBR6043078.1 hypothetical protein [Paludibacteraceae bacterium]MCR5569381.1 hypothetical protein [Paludibacteraceae bacterium]
MAENEENTLEKLAENVDNLISLCEQLKAERDAALNRVAEIAADLANANAKIRTLEQKNRTLQSMQLGDVSVVAAKQNKAQLSKLVREIDKCIALLNT